LKIDLLLNRKLNSNENQTLKLKRITYKPKILDQKFKVSISPDPAVDELGEMVFIVALLPLYKMAYIRFILKTRYHW